MSFFSKLGDKLGLDNNFYRNFRQNVRDPYLNAKTGGMWGSGASSWSIVHGGGSISGSKALDRDVGADVSEGASSMPLVLAAVGLYLISKRR